MTQINHLLSQVSDISLEDYCPFGLATCFVRDEGEIHEVKIIEPVPSAALEAVLLGIPTSYEFICGKTLGELFEGDSPRITDDFPQEAQLCDRFIERAIAATRTFKNRPSATKHIPIGTIKRDLNYSLSKKRILNNTTVVSAEDNVKQHQYTHQVL
jgi:hypothetical protein